MKKTKKIPTLVGIIILLAGLVAGVILIGGQQVFKLGASAEATPKNVRVANISDNSFTLTWMTEKSVLGFVKWGEQSNSLTNIVEDEMGKQSFTHTVTVRGLGPQDDYYFIINSEGSNFDNNGAPWSVSTGPTLTTPDRHDIISGTVLTSSGTPAQDVLVYVVVGGSNPLSTTTSINGSWLIPMSSARSQALNSFIDIAPTSTLIEISAQASINSASTAQIYPQSAKPVAPMKLGQTHDFRSLPASAESDLPQFSIDLPEEESTEESGFTIPEDLSSPEPSVVTLESIEEGETVVTADPEFFGGGPPGTEITLTLESDLVTDTISVNSSGNWNWSPPDDLEEGIHKITVSWNDAVGILHTLTRTFIVQASEGPSFESTPSASPSPTATPTAAPTSSPSPSPTPTTTATPTSTGSALPDAGSLTPTLILSIMGLGLITFGFILSIIEKKKIFN